MEREAAAEIDVLVLPTDMAAGAPDGRVQVRVTPQPCQPLSPPSALWWMIGNLPDNALRYAGDQTIELVGDQSEKMVRVGVMERGLGIPTEQRR